MKRLIYVLFFVLLAGTSYAQRAKYVFYFIGDGMGVNQVNGTEMYLAEQEGRIGVKPLLFTTFPTGTVATTFSATNSVTDSSAAGTALATGAKTYNGAIGMDDDKNALQTVAEKAKKAGRKVGVTTSVSVETTLARRHSMPTSPTVACITKLRLTCRRPVSTFTQAAVS